MNKIERFAEESARDLIDAYPESFPDALDVSAFMLDLTNEIMTRIENQIDSEDDIDDALSAFNQDDSIWEFMADYIEKHSN